MRKTVYLSVGPSELYPSYAQHLQWAMDEQLGSLNHRSERFREIYRATDTQLRELMAIPPSHRIYFTGSATEIWERLLLNLVTQRSHHLVNGAFSERFFNFSQALGKTPSCERVPLGAGFELERSEIPPDTELVCTTQNETSTGVCIPERDLGHLKLTHPDILLCTDIVSSAPLVRLDFSHIDSAFFSVQKGFGMPAGLGVWIANEACLQRARTLSKKGLLMGAHHTLLSLEACYQRFETPSTPNTVAIAILGRIAQDMNRFGIDRLRNENQAKQECLDLFLSTQNIFTHAVANPEHRSPTVRVLQSHLDTPSVLKQLVAQGFELSAGYGQAQGGQIRIGLFPATTLGQVEDLISALQTLRPPT